MERSQTVTRYGLHAVLKQGGVWMYRWQEPGKFGVHTVPVVGAEAEYEPGNVLNPRMRGRRVVAGAIIAGPVGAIIGGMLKKDPSRGYVTVIFADGQATSFDAPMQDEPKLKAFVAAVNAAASESA